MQDPQLAKSRRFAAAITDLAITREALLVLISGFLPLFPPAKNVAPPAMDLGLEMIEFLKEER